MNYTMDDLTIKNNIAFERERVGLTQAEMADKIGIGRNTYRNLEKGETHILNIHLDALSGALGVSKEKLVLGYDPADLSGDGVLNDPYRESYAKKIKELEDQNNQLRSDNKNLREMCQQLRSQLADKDTIIAFLKQRQTP